MPVLSSPNDGSCFYDWFRKKFGYGPSPFAFGGGSVVMVGSGVWVAWREVSGWMASGPGWWFVCGVCSAQFGWEGAVELLVSNGLVGVVVLLGAFDEVG